MKFIDQRCELPWAVPKKPGYAGKASGLFFDFFATEREAKKAHAALRRAGKWTDEVRHMPGHAYRLGSFAF